MYSYDATFGLGDPAWLDPAIAGVIFLISLILSVVFNKLLFPLILRFANWTPTDLDSQLVRATRRPLTAGIVILGTYLALTIPLSLDSSQQNLVDSIHGVLGILLGTVFLTSAVSILFTWYMVNLGSRSADGLDTRLFPLFRRFAVAAVYVLGGLMIMDQLGINISPLIAGLGLGGLAVALAIQPTLANLFAGTYVMTEGVVGPGDYIELEGGVSGYVVEVSWRSIRIRTWGNNLVVIPNSRFAETIITNYQKPAPPVNVYLTCGVSYNSDLFHVEKVSMEVMNDLLENDPSGVKEYGAYFGFESFGDSNVDFWLFLQAKDRLRAFVLRSNLIQRLHHRFKEEGIVINYPVRTIQMAEESNAELAPAPPWLGERPSTARGVSSEGGEGGDGGPDLD